MSTLLDSLLYRLPLPHMPGLGKAAEDARAEAGIPEHEIDESMQFAINDLCGECGRAERAMKDGDNDAARDILISAARDMLSTLGAT